MTRIFFWTAGRTDACTFYRCAEPGRVLRKLGHEVAWDYQVGLATLMTADVVVIQRPTEPNALLLMGKLLALPQDRRPRVVVELDDDLFSLPEHHPVHAMMADPARGYRLNEAIGQADVVTVTNEHLADRVRGARGYAPHGTVRVVPNYVPERFVVDKVPELAPIGKPTITWAGSDTHRRDFDEVAVPLRKLLRERSDFRVRIVGAPYASRLRTAAGMPGVTDVRVAQVPWVEGVDRYIPTLAGHIGLAPLADDLFNRSKSDLRLKELAARGMAVLSSETGPYADSAVPRLLIEDGEPTIGWAPTIARLLDTPELREEVATRALDWAQANTLEAHADEWEAALLDN